ncbi:MAG: hypothetical protein GX640_07275 [Fibrobacter sp.]|nr:hypothetical protein [Fibrobacter sp.]
MPVDGVESSGRVRVEQKPNQNRSENTQSAETERKLVREQQEQTRAARSASEAGQGESIDISA